MTKACFQSLSILSSIPENQNRIVYVVGNWPGLAAWPSTTQLMSLNHKTLHWNRGKNTKGTKGGLLARGKAFPLVAFGAGKKKSGRTGCPCDPVSTYLACGAFLHLRCLSFINCKMGRIMLPLQGHLMIKCDNEFFKNPGRVLIQ